nr:aminodeoxychorismate synthase component I [Bacteroidota bacterium]
MLNNFITKVNAFAAQRKAFLFVIDYNMAKPEVFPLDEMPDNIFYQTPSHQNIKNEQDVLPDFQFISYPPSYNEYREAFRKVITEISYGNSYLLNLTFKSKIETSLGLWDIYFHSKAKYKLFFRDQFVVFSPEPFIRIEEGKISSYPMKGTIDATIPNAEKLLLADAKETAEHHTIVDLIRNDLSMVSEDVRVEKFRYIEKLKTHKGELLQMSSKIVGNLPEGFENNLAERILQLLPAGSITGAPKSKTVEIIAKAENYKRNYYTGIFGVYDGNTLESAVMIRFIEKDFGQLYFKSGGGITSMSDPVKEYDELIQKIYVPFA